MNKRVFGKLNKGFTVVELIVVLVILAVLAAILVPALLGFIDKAKNRKDVELAKQLSDAAQAQMAILYAKPTGATENCVVPGGLLSSKPGGKPNGNADVSAYDTDFASKVFDLVSISEEDKPFLFMIACGSTLSDKTTQHEMYTVYYAVYMKTEHSEPLYYYNGAWTSENPSVVGVFDKNNNMTVNGKKLRLQYYLLTEAGGKSLWDDFGKDKNLWWWLKNTVKDGKN